VSALIRGCSFDVTCDIVKEGECKAEGVAGGRFHRSGRRLKKKRRRRWGGMLSRGRAYCTQQ